MWLLSPCMKTYWNSVRSKISPQKPAVIFKIPSFKWAGEGIQEETLLLNILIYSCDHFEYHQFNLSFCLHCPGHVVWAAQDHINCANKSKLHDQLCRTEHQNTFHICGSGYLSITDDTKVTLSTSLLSLVCVSGNCSCLSCRNYIYDLAYFLQLQLDSFP